MRDLDRKYQTDIIHYVDLLRERYFMYDQLVDFLVETLGNHNVTGKILSLGCGTCSIETRLAKQGFGVIAIDHDEQSLEIAHHRIFEQNIDIELIQGDFFDVLPSNQVDVVLLLFSALSIDKVKNVAHNVSQILNKNGVFICDLYGWSDSDTATPLTFVDTFSQEGKEIVCISSYFAELSNVTGHEVYLIKSLATGNLELRVDNTNIPVLSDNELSSIYETVNLEEFGFKPSNEAWITQNICPTAAPPFCIQKLLLWKKAYGD